MKSLRSLIGATLAAAVVITAAGCSAAPSKSSSTPSVNADTNATVRIVTPGGFLSLDPQLGQIGNTSSFYVNVFDGLYTVNQKGQVIPSLAESSTVNSDDTQYTFTLRKGVKFQDGSPLTSADVKFTLDRAIDPATASPSAGDLSSIKSVQVDGADKVIVQLKSPNPIFRNNLLSMGALILPKAYFDKVGAAGFAKKPIGSGPFEFVSYSEGQRLVLKRYDDYWGGRAKVKEIDFDVATESATQNAMVQSGQADLISGLDPRFEAQMKSSGLKIVTTPSGEPTWILFQAQRGISDVRVRQALNYAVDKDAIVKTVFHGEAKPLGGMIATSLPGYSAELKPYPYDPAKAKELLKEGSFDFNTTVAINVAIGRYPGSQDAAQAIVANLKAVGVKASVHMVDYGTMGGQLVQKKSTNAYLDMANRAYDPLSGIISMTSCAGALSTTCDRTYEALLSTASTKSGADRAAALGAVNSYLHDHPAGIFLYETTLLTVMNTKVTYSPPPATSILYNLDTLAIAR